MTQKYIVIMSFAVLLAGCGLQNPPGGSCGNNSPLGHNNCQCVVPNGYSEYSEHSQDVEDASNVDVSNCLVNTKSYSVELADNEVVTCKNFECGKTLCPQGYIRDPKDGHRIKCISVGTAAQCTGKGEIYRESDQSCICDSDNHWKGQAGSCTCDTGYKQSDNQCIQEDLAAKCPGAGEIYRESDQSCICDSDNHWIGVSGECACEQGRIPIAGVCQTAITCDKKGEIRDDSTNKCICNREEHYAGAAGACECDDSSHRDSEGTCVDCGEFRWDPILLKCTEEKKPSVARCGEGAIKIKAGDLIEYGHYPQSGTETDPLPIVWQVLVLNEEPSKDSHVKMLLMSKYILDVQAFSINIQSLASSIPWKTCTLRSWLNGFGAGENLAEIDYSKDNFMQTAFSDEEQKCIILNRATDDNIPDVNERIFILSYDEIMLYLPKGSDDEYKDKIALATPYARNVIIVDGAYNCPDVYCPASWWLRPEQSEIGISYFTPTGYPVSIIDKDGVAKIGVRPFIWLDLSVK